MRRPLPGLAAVIAVLSLLSAACAGVSVGAKKPASGAGGTFGNTGRTSDGCTAVPVASSPEKLELLSGLATQFNGSSAAKVGGRCSTVSVHKTSSGVAADLLARGWPNAAADGPQPVVWSPAASSWGAILDQRLADGGQPAMAPTDARSFMLTPLTIAMPKPMAMALGYPNTPIGYADLIALSKDPGGWASKGHPEWGPFKLGKTNPNQSTSALSSTIAQYYAATGKVRDLSLEDLARPDVTAFGRSVESAVVHYGDTTLTFLNALARADARGTGLTYVSAVAVEEKSVIDYNSGNPDGITDPGEQLRPPRVPLVAVYPKEGTLFSDHPFYVLNAPWVNAPQRAAARAFEVFLQRPENQRKALAAGFRPGNTSVALGAPIDAAHGVDPAQPQTTLDVPAPPVLVRLVQKWGEDRKGARVLLDIDVSGSMGDEVASGQTKLDLAKQAAIHALDQFKGDDQVGLRVFSTGVGPPEHRDYLDLVPIGAIAGDREQLATRIGSLEPTQGTPLYTVARDSYTQAVATLDPTRINAVLLLTDGKNEDPRNTDLNGLLAALRTGTEGSSGSGVRLFTIGYGKDADLGTLRRMAEATNGASYDASDPTTIDKVFTAVVSNF